MNCKNCGAEISSNVKFCPECGQKIPDDNFAKTIQLKCKDCGGTMSTDSDRLVLSCPFCGSKEIVQESDAVTIERIKNQTQKDIEFAKIKHESEKEQKKYEREQKEKADAQVDNFKKSLFSKVLIGSFIICLLATFLSFKRGYLLCGIIALAQTGLFATAWLMGMDFVKEKMKKMHILLAVIGFALIILFLFSTSFRLSAFKEKKVPSPTISENMDTNEEEGIYTYQIRDYSGKNAASVGRTASNMRLDEYGAGYLNIIFVAENGIYINPLDEEQLKDYVISGQNIKPNTNITIVNERDNKGKPYDNLVDYQSYDEIELYVNKVSEEPFNNESFVQIAPTLDRHTYHIRNYVGRNAASFGSFVSNYRFDEYGAGTLRLSFVSDTGEYIDISDINVLKQYIVVEQDIKANTELALVYDKDSKGEEYDNLIESQNYEEITLKVKKLDDNTIAQMPLIETSNPNEVSSNYDTLDVEYKVLSNGTVEITGYSGDGSMLEIASEIDGKKVTRIGDSAFENCSSLTDVIFWADIKEIGKSAFKNCTSLTSIDISSEAKLIDEHAFEGCTALSNVIFWGSPDIESYAFAGCISLESVDIGYDTKVVKSHAFDGCTSLKSVIVWNDGTKIEKDAFANCPNLEDVPGQDSNYEQSSSKTPEPEKAPEATPSSEPVKTPKTTPTPKPTPTPTPKPKPTATPEPTKTPQPTPEPTKEPPVEKGISSEDIKKLIHMDFVEDASDIEAFAKAHKGEEITLELFTAYVENNKDYKTRFNYLLYAVEGDDVMLSGPAFMFKDVSYYGLNLTGSNIPDSFGIGIHCKVTAEIDGYEDGMFLLDPVEIEVINEY